MSRSPACSVSGIAVVLVVSALAAAFDAAQNELDSRITEVDPRLYDHFVDPGEWLNPWLTVTPEGILVRARGLPEHGVTVPPEDLARTLAGLPLGAWPLGRIVVFSNPGTVPWHPTDTEWNRRRDDAIDRNREAAQVVLRDLDVAIKLWPA